MLHKMMQEQNRYDTYSPAENKFDLELNSKVFFFTESCSVDIAFEESE